MSLHAGRWGHQGHQPDLQRHRPGRVPLERSPNLSLGLTAGCFGILGNYLGARLFSQRGARWTRPLIIVVLAIFFGKVCLSLL